MIRSRILFALVIGFAALFRPVEAQLPSEQQRLGRDILKELIETDTTGTSGNTTVAAERMVMPSITEPDRP